MSALYRSSSFHLEKRASKYVSYHEAIKEFTKVKQEQQPQLKMFVSVDLRIRNSWENPNWSFVAAASTLMVLLKLSLKHELGSCKTAEIQAKS